MLVLEAKGNFIIPLAEIELDLWFWKTTVEVPAKHKRCWENNIFDLCVVFKTLTKLPDILKIKLKIDTVRCIQQQKAHLFPDPFILQHLGDGLPKWRQMQQSI